MPTKNIVRLPPFGPPSGITICGGGIIFGGPNGAGSGPDGEIFLAFSSLPNSIVEIREPGAGGTTPGRGGIGVGIGGFSSIFLGILIPVGCWPDFKLAKSPAIVRIEDWYSFGGVGIGFGAGGGGVAGFGGVNEETGGIGGFGGVKDDTGGGVAGLGGVNGETGGTGGLGGVKGGGVGGLGGEGGVKDELPGIGGFGGVGAEPVLLSLESSLTKSSIVVTLVPESSGMSLNAK